MEKTNGSGFFLREGKITGIIRIENMLSGRFLLVKSTDCITDCRKIRFSLDLGTFQCPGLQKDYGETGLELFDISVVEEAEKKEDLDHLLAKWKDLLEKKGMQSY